MICIFDLVLCEQEGNIGSKKYIYIGLIVKYLDLPSGSKTGTHKILRNSLNFLRVSVISTVKAIILVHKIVVTIIRK